MLPEPRFLSLTLPREGRLVRKRYLKDVSNIRGVLIKSRPLTTLKTHRSLALVDYVLLILALLPNAHPGSSHSRLTAGHIFFYPSEGPIFFFYLSSILSPAVICKLDIKSPTVTDGLPAGPQMVIHGCAVSSEILPLSPVLRCHLHRCYTHCGRPVERSGLRPNLKQTGNNFMSDLKIKMADNQNAIESSAVQLCKSIFILLGQNYCNGTG